MLLQVACLWPKGTQSKLAPGEKVRSVHTVAAGEKCSVAFAASQTSSVLKTTCPPWSGEVCSCRIICRCLICQATSGYLRWRNPVQVTENTLHFWTSLFVLSSYRTMRTLGLCASELCSSTAKSFNNKSEKLKMEKRMHKKKPFLLHHFDVKLKSKWGHQHIHKSVFIRNEEHTKSVSQSVISINVTYLLCVSCRTDWLQSGCDLVHVLSGNQLLLDPCGGTLPPQPHLYDLLLGQKVSVGIYPDWMGWVVPRLHSSTMHVTAVQLKSLGSCKLKNMSAV